MKDTGAANDMLQRLAEDTSFGVSGADLRASTDASRFVGRAPEQVDEFLAGVIRPILAASAGSSVAAAQVRV